MKIRGVRNSGLGVRGGVDEVINVNPNLIGNDNANTICYKRPA